MDSRIAVIASPVNAGRVHLKIKDIYGAIYELGLGSAMPMKIEKCDKGFIMYFDCEADRDIVLDCKVLCVDGIELDLIGLRVHGFGDNRVCADLADGVCGGVVDAGSADELNSGVGKAKLDGQSGTDGATAFMTPRCQANLVNSVLLAAETQLGSVGHKMNPDTFMFASKYRDPVRYGFSRALLDEGME